MTRNVAVSKLIQYLRIKTVHPEPNYAAAISFLKDYAKEIGVDDCREVQVAPGRSVLIMSVFGREKSEKTVLLNSHTDVVPVNQEFWKCDPFEGKRFENGDIYGRGIQDMKSVGIQHLELIRKLKENNIIPKRTIHLTFAPDEEIGGVNGIGAFIKTKEFADLNVGVCLDEGLANPTEEFSLFYGERVQWWITVKFTGNTGHGSRFIENTAAEKLRKILNKMLSYREEQKHKLDSNCNCMKLGDVTTVNLTGLKGGLAHNIVPAIFEANFDVRITPSTDLNEFREKLQGWINEAEEDDTGSITYSFVYGKDNKPAISSIDEDVNPWWKSFRTSCSELDIKLSTEIFPAGTDARYLREIGITAFGFSPINNTPILLHDHNEFLNESVFLRGKFI